MLVNPASVATSITYELAPPTAFQLAENEEEVILVAALEVGAVGVASVVVL